MGQRATVSGSAIFDDMPADPELVLPYHDPHTIYRYGRLAARVHAAEALLASAAATLDEVTRRPRDADAAARGSVAAADERHDLSRHWRNARTHASHDPADWKYHYAGNYLLNHVRPPNLGQV